MGSVLGVRLPPGPTRFVSPRSSVPADPSSHGSKGRARLSRCSRKRTMRGAATSRSPTRLLARGRSTWCGFRASSRMSNSPGNSPYWQPSIVNSPPSAARSDSTNAAPGAFRFRCTTARTNGAVPNSTRPHRVLPNLPRPFPRVARAGRLTLRAAETAPRGSGTTRRRREPEVDRHCGRDLRHDRVQDPTPGAPRGLTAQRILLRKPVHDDD